MTKKRILFSVILVLFFHLSQAQLIMIDVETGAYKYEKVVSTEKISKQEITNRANKWLNSYYNDDFQIENDSTSIRKQGFYSFSWLFVEKNMPTEIFFDIEIKTKESRYKYTFSNFKVGKITNDGIDASNLKAYIKRFPREAQINIEEPIDTEMTKAIHSLEYYILNNKLEIIDDDW